MSPVSKGCRHNATHQGDPSWFYASHPPYFAVIPRNPKCFFFQIIPSWNIGDIPGTSFGFVRSQWLTTMVAVPPSSGGISQVPLKVGAFQAMKSGWCGNIPKKQTEKHINKWRNKKHTSPILYSIRFKHIKHHHLMAWGPQAMNRSNAKPEGR